MPLFTDAPADWPPINLTGLGENHHMNAVNVAKELTAQFNKDDKYRVTSFLESIFLEEGILQTHITVTGSEKKYYLFFFNKNEEISSRFYSGIKYIFSNSDNIESVYYSNFDLNPDAKPALPLRQFAPDLLTKLGKSTPEGPYVVWKNDDENGQFSESKEFSYISEYQVVCNGIHSYLLAEILRSLKDIEDNVGKVQLPEEEYSLGLIGPENRPLILSASWKNGIMLHFHNERCSSRYRTLFWKHFLAYAKDLKDYIVRNDIELDKYSGKTPKEFWEDISKDIIEKEKSGERLQNYGVF